MSVFLGAVYYNRKAFSTISVFLGAVDTLLELLWAVILPAVGAAVVFNVGSSTGGTDIIARILNQKTSVEVGNALLIIDLFIVLAAGLVFGIKTFLFCTVRSAPSLKVS